MTHEHILRTVGRVKGFVFLVAASMQLVLLAFAFALTGTAAAQNSNSQQKNDNQIPQITVQASHEVQRKQVGMSYTGIPVEEVSLSRHVGFRDLALTTAAGKDELDKRIKAEAKEAATKFKSCIRWSNGIPIPALVSRTQLRVLWRRSRRYSRLPRGSSWHTRRATQ